MPDKKYEGMKAVTDWIKNCPSEEFMKTFNELKDDYSGPTIGDFLGIDDCPKDDNEPEECYDINQDFRELLEELKQLDINISNFIQVYDCILLNDKCDYFLVHDTREYIKKCIEYIESLSFMRDKE